MGMADDFQLLHQTPAFPATDRKNESWYHWEIQRIDAHCQLVSTMYFYSTFPEQKSQNAYQK